MVERRKDWPLRCAGAKHEAFSYDDRVTVSPAEVRRGATRRNVGETGPSLKNLPIANPRLSEDGRILGRTATPTGCKTFGNVPNATLEGSVKEASGILSLLFHQTAIFFGDRMAKPADEPRNNCLDLDISWREHETASVVTRRCPWPVGGRRWCAAGFDDDPSSA